MYTILDQIIAQTIGYVDVSDHEILFYTQEGRVFSMCNDEDRLNDVEVYVEDIAGDLNDLIGVPLVRAEERSENGSSASGPWTFYEFATIKGSVTIRWFGESNGFYSETVSFVELY